MADITAKYGTAGTAITVTLASLANNAARSSAVIDNTSDLFLDVLVQLIVVFQAGSPATGASVNVYAYGTADSDTVAAWGDTELDGTDKAITMDSPTNLRLIGAFNVRSSAETVESSPMSVAAAFGGVVPRKWGIVVENKSGMTMSATEGDHKKIMQGLKGQST